MEMNIPKEILSEVKKVISKPDGVSAVVFEDEPSADDYQEYMEKNLPERFGVFKYEACNYKECGHSFMVVISVNANWPSEIF